MELFENLPTPDPGESIESIQEFDCPNCSTGTAHIRLQLPHDDFYRCSDCGSLVKTETGGPHPAS